MENNTESAHEDIHETALVTEGHHVKVDTTPGLETVTNVVAKELKPLATKQVRFETWWILVFLVFALLILKGFIYIKDDKRHGR